MRLQNHNCDYREGVEQLCLMQVTLTWTETFTLLRDLKFQRINWESKSGDRGNPEKIAL